MRERAQYTLSTLTADEIISFRAELIALLEDAVNGGASVSFLAPMDHAIADQFWDKVAHEVTAQSRVVVVARLDSDQSIVGCAHLAFAGVPNGQHRSDVQKVLVLSRYRRQGIATALMQALEQSARDWGKTLLVLDTAQDGGAEPLYLACGYVRAGIIPLYAQDPFGKLIDTVYYYKQL